jgi:hypothetical protein
MVHDDDARITDFLFLFLQIASSYGQNLQNTTYRGETIFCILICIMGLVFFSHLIGNMQVYIYSFILLKMYALFSHKICPAIVDIPPINVV